MGCTSFKAKRMSMNIVGHVREDVGDDPKRSVQEYPYVNTRLSPIDYESIIANELPWTDPYFKPDN